MKLIERQLEKTIRQHMFGRKAILLIGARQVGKSTLMEQVVKDMPDAVLRLNCDEPEVRNMLEGINLHGLQMLIGSNRIVIIDEAQRVRNIGLTLKLITDGLPDIQLLVTGSSSLQLGNEINEPLTGRKWEYHLFPIATRELMDDRGWLGVKQTMESRLIFGSYWTMPMKREAYSPTFRAAIFTKTCCRWRV